MPTNGMKLGNCSSYADLKSTAATRKPDDVQYHIDLIFKHTRRLLELGGTVEQCLDLVLESARREFCCRVLVRAPACIRIDGHDYRWPIE
jgi:hypothetical protein